MNMHDLILNKEDVTLLDQYLARYVEDTGVKLALLMNRDGHMLAHNGSIASIDLFGLCALSVGAFLSSEALAQMTGEDSFSTISHKGSRHNVFIAAVGDNHLLLTIYDYNASEPLVRLQAKVTAENIITVLDRVLSNTGSPIR